MWQIKFSQQAIKDFKKFSQNIQQLINNKLKFYSVQTEVLKWARPLVNLPPATHRFRVSKYRIYFYLENQTIFIQKIRLRGQDYKR